MPTNFIEHNIRENLGFGNESSDIKPNGCSMKGKKKNSLKLKTSALQKIMLIKRQYIDQEKVFAKVHVTKDISEIYR